MCHIHNMTKKNTLHSMKMCLSKEKNVLCKNIGDNKYI